VPPAALSVFDVPPVAVISVPNEDVPAAAPTVRVGISCPGWQS
jgi:hypothetical protein